MRMKEIIACLLVMMFLVSSMPMMSVPAAAHPDTGVPSNPDEIKAVARTVLVDEIMRYLRATYLGETVKHLGRDALREAASNYPHYPRQITDSAGREVRIYKPIKRIITPNGDCMPVLRALNATDKIVGVNKYTIKNTLFYPEFSNYLNIGSVWSPDYEEMVCCSPDTVILYATIFKSQCEAIESALSAIDPDITFIWVDCYRPSSQVEEARKLGYLLEKEEEAEKWIDFYEGFLNPIYDTVDDMPEENRIKVYIECWKPYHTAAGNAGWHKKIELVGGYNIFRELTVDYPDVDPENVTYQNPEVIIRIAKTEGGYDTSDITELSGLRGEIMNRPELANVTAVKNERVYVINSDILSGTGHFVGMGYIAKWLYPDLFTNLNPEAAHRRYLTEFQGLSDSLVNNGVFVYPSI
ncbi:MAG: ABC transporter substrate-binding protein [Methanocellales archaeon]|nr:ABC transporter substrate-binding protein [Methanocellales archaeon]